MGEKDLLDFIKRIERVRSVPFACQAAVDAVTASIQHTSASIHLLNGKCDRLDAVAYSKHPPASFHLPKGRSRRERKVPWPCIPCSSKGI